MKMDTQNLRTHIQSKNLDIYQIVLNSYLKLIPVRI